jgi:sulfopropanediol 3-dehydrogenase
MIAIEPELGSYVKRPTAISVAESDEVRAVAAEIIDAVRRDGQAAICHYARRLDAWEAPTFRVAPEAICEAEAVADPADLAHLDFALERVRAFAELQRECLLPLEREVLPGVVLGHRLQPVNAVGAYVPGGRYPLIASALMTIAVPKVAGVARVIACAPPQQGHQRIHPLQLVAMSRAGADAIYCVGGVQALAAMAFGPDEFGPPVDMLVGAGNAYVAEAKRQLFGVCGIDLLAGPTELLIIADAHAEPRLVAADLLGQAEHGPTSEVVLVTTSRALADAVLAEVDTLLMDWPTRGVAAAAWRDRGAVIVCPDPVSVVAAADAIASEHVEIHCDDADWYADRLTNFGTLFIGSDATVVYSDKAIGTNHVLPTGRAARYTSGLWVGSFIRALTYQRVTSYDGTAAIAPVSAAIADAEGMLGHAITARLRLEQAAVTR